MKTIAGLTASALLFACGTTLASYISMATELSIKVSPTGLVLVVTSANRGDEPAYGVQFEVQAGDKQFTSEEVSRLTVDEKIVERFPVGDAFRLPGRYPIVIKTHYKDGNAYPFSALTVAFYDHHVPVVSKILIQPQDADIPSNGSGTVSVLVRNADSVPRDLEIVLHLPDELVAVAERQSLQLAPGSEETLYYDVANFSALDNSSYSVALIAQYEDGVRHYSASGAALARITAPPVMTVGSIWVFAGAAAVVLVLLFAALLRWRQRIRS